MWVPLTFEEAPLRFRLVDSAGSVLHVDVRPVSQHEFSLSPAHFQSYTFYWLNGRVGRYQKGVSHMIYDHLSEATTWVGGGVWWFRR